MCPPTVTLAPTVAQAPHEKGVRSRRPCREQSRSGGFGDGMAAAPKDGMTPRLLGAACLILVTLLSLPTLGSAQPGVRNASAPIPRLSLRPTWTLALSEPSAGPIVAPHERSAQTAWATARGDLRLEVAWAMVGIGAGMAGGAAFVGTRLGRPGYCDIDYAPHGYVPIARVAAGVLGGIGVAVSFTGAGLVLSVPRSERRAIGGRGRNRLAYVANALGGSVAGLAWGMFGVFATSFLSGGLAECWSS